MFDSCREISEHKRDTGATPGHELQLTLALEVAGAGTWDWLSLTGEMHWSIESLSLFGTARDCPRSFDAFMDRVHPGDRDQVRQKMTHAMSGRLSCDTEFRVIGADDTERWIAVKGRASAESRTLGMQGVFVDVTTRHDTERHLRELGRRLVAAHEQERRRLSRELHDDVSQRVVLMSIGFAALRRRLDEGSEDIRLQVETLSDQLRDVASTLHRISHQLHPVLIHQVGLEKALRGLCDDVGRIQGLVVHCQFLYCGPAIDDDIGLGLYRIAQEALTNVVKHSGGSQASVSLDASDERIVLNISDNGAGFDPTTSGANQSLGLISMRERARLMNGRLNLITRPGAGTRVEVCIPATFKPVLTHTGSTLV